MKPAIRNLRRATVIGLGAVILTAAVLGPALGSNAEGFVPLPRPKCPSPVASLGYPIDDSPLISPGDVLEIGSSDPLPSGVTIEGDHLVGAPTTVGSASFALLAIRHAGGGSTSTGARCSIAVRPAPVVERLAGSDRYQQALKVSARLSSASRVFVASGEKFADALSATSVATASQAPLLLTPHDALPTGLLDELRRLGAKSIVVVGGSASVSEAVLGQLKGAVPSIQRIDGADRYEVSRNLIRTFGDLLASPQNLYIATGANFPDALSASPAASSIKGAVLLVDGSEKILTPAETTLVNDLGVQHVFLAGGPVSISHELEAALTKSFTVTRYGGADRFDVGLNVNRATFTHPDAFTIASGAVFPDALTGGVLAGTSAAPVYITQPTCLSAGVYREIGRLAPRTITILGGTATLSPDVEALKPCSG